MLVLGGLAYIHTYIYISTQDMQRHIDIQTRKSIDGSRSKAQGIFYMSGQLHRQICLRESSAMVPRKLIFFY